VIGAEQLSYLFLSTGVMDKFRGTPENVMNMNSFFFCIVLSEVWFLKNGFTIIRNWTQKAFYVLRASRYWAFDHVREDTQSKRESLHAEKC
jgi:hypothetical protein